MHVHDLMSLTGKVAMVTGGGRGLGAQMALALAEAGASVLLCSRKLDACAAVAADLNRQGYTALSRALDVTDPDQVECVVAEVTDQMGDIAILVNNAGASWGAPAESMPLDRWQMVMNTNVTGTFLMSQAVGRRMIARGTGGKIINIASVAGLRGSSAAVLDATGYAASKGAVIAYTRDLAAKWAAHNIYVNAIAPGWFPSAMTRAVLERSGDAIISRTPLRRFGGPDDLKGVVVLLASAASNYITGQVIAVDGGMTAIL